MGLNGGPFAWSLFSSISCKGASVPASTVQGLHGSSCPPGHFCSLEMTDPIPCPPGSFNSDTHKPKCYICPRGHYCVPGMKPQLCPRGGYPVSSSTRQLGVQVRDVTISPSSIPRHWVHLISIKEPCSPPSAHEAPPHSCLPLFLFSQHCTGLYLPPSRLLLPRRNCT